MPQGGFVVLEGSIECETCICQRYSQILTKRTPAQYGHLIITDSLLYPWGKKALRFSVKSTRLIRTPHYYEQFSVSLGKESPYIFS